MGGGVAMSGITLAAKFERDPGLFAVIVMALSLTLFAIAALSGALVLIAQGLVVVTGIVPFLRGRATVRAWASARGMSYRRRSRSTPTRFAVSDGPMYALARIGQTASRTIDRKMIHKPVRDLATDGSDIVTFHTAHVGPPDWHGRLLALSSDLALPVLSISRRDDEIFGANSPHTFESGTFNDTWLVTTHSDGRYASAFMHARLLDMFNDAPEHLRRVDFSSPWLISWLPIGCTAEQLDAHLTFLQRTRDQVPRFVREDYKPKPRGLTER